ncbi:Uncharacterized conserved protein, UPF0335 family [Methylobacterium gossipiicola]|uniref:UPF0335 protein SAMN05192565_107178 n=1 Tax=Methylobacterium gossipiicola TaxID=582675 RepID=A0A1I2TSK6_9HYPH|nr:Uncharacterized conserved protein, UPF0335 family [Methylobacterium gossipiicola]
MVSQHAASPQVDASSVAADQLKSFIERIERLEEEKAGLASDIKDVYAEAKGTGFDVKTIRKIVRLRKMDHAKRQEEEAVLELYMMALGMLGDTPLGRSAVEREVAQTKITISAGGRTVETTGTKLAEATARMELQSRVKDAFAGVPGVTVTTNARIPRRGASVLRTAAKRMRSDGQIDIEDAIAGRA